MSSYLVARCVKDGPEFFAGLNVITGVPMWSDAGHAQLWESRSRAEAEAITLIRRGELGTQQTPVQVAFCRPRGGA